MKELLKRAMRVSDQAEAYSHSYSFNHVSFQDAKLQNIGSSMQMGVSLRIIKGGKLGFAYTRNLRDRDELVENALISLSGQVAADYEFPQTKEVQRLNASNSALSSVTNSELVDEGSRICDLLRSQTDADVGAELITTTQRTQLMNSMGADLSDEGTRYAAFAVLGFPDSGSRFLRMCTSTDFLAMSDEAINELVFLYRSGNENVAAKGGRMKVLFMPYSLITFNWRLASGLSGKSVHEGISPLAPKVGERIVSEQITLFDDPLDDSQPLSRTFDDEGIACRRSTMIENGVLKNFFTDIKYAQKLGKEPSGHGYRTELWGGEPSMLTPIPTLAHLRLDPGGADLGELLKLMDTGLIVEGALGFNSGNIPNGDYSIGVNPGFYVENGEIVGRVKDAMVAGNVYETLQKVIAVGKKAVPTWTASLWHYSVMPPLLCENVSVITRES